jgi:hypothetical protein
VRPAADANILELFWFEEVSKTFKQKFENHEN